MKGTPHTPCHRVGNYLQALAVVVDDDANMKTIIKQFHQEDGICGKYP
jgi:hypothetical protein